MFLRVLQRVLIFAFSATFLALLAVGIVRVKQHGEADDGAPRAVSATPGTTARQSGSGGGLTGQSYDTPWGPVTVSVKLSGGKIAAIDTPDYPDSGPSVDARSILIDQAIKAGNANIQGVSGATYTSLAFKRSLENALASR
jgi:uncharacterized protein with FMN-binding domain